MIGAIFVEPHERQEAIAAYADRLTTKQIQEIEDAPESALVRLNFGIGLPSLAVEIIEEG